MDLTLHSSVSYCSIGIMCSTMHIYHHVGGRKRSRMRTGVGVGILTCDAIFSRLAITRDNHTFDLTFIILQFLRLANMSIRSCTNLLRSSISSTSSPLILARRCIASASGSGIASGSGSSTRSQSIIYNSPSSSSPRSPLRNSPSGYGTTRSSRVVSRFFGSTRTICAEGPSDIAPAPGVNVT